MDLSLVIPGDRRALRVLHIAGANVTAPFKEAILPHLDALSEGARIIGAVNTIVRDNGRLKGYNTNAIGIMDALGSAAFSVEEIIAMKAAGIHVCENLGALGGLCKKVFK